MGQRTQMGERMVYVALTMTVAVQSCGRFSCSSRVIVSVKAQKHV